MDKGTCSPAQGHETCSECSEPAKARGFCSSHYMRWWSYGDPNFIPPPRERATCTAPEGDAICGRPVQGNGYCSKHNRRFRVHGDPSIVLPPTLPPTIRKHALNEEYFSQIDTPDKAYWLGFVTADGCVSRERKGYSLSLELKESDAGHLLKFARAIGTDAPVAPTRQRCVRIRVNSLRLVDDLAALGVTPRKSLVVEPPTRKLAGLEAYYWRGLWDGDGHISTTVRNGSVRWDIGIVGSEACVSGFASWACEISGSAAQVHNASAKSACRAWNVRGVRKPQLIAGQLKLAGTSTGLDRKQQRLEELCAVDLDERRARQSAAQSVRMLETWASGRHARAKSRTM